MVILSLKLLGPPMLVDKTKFGSVLYNHTNFYRFVIGQLHDDQFFSVFYWSTSVIPPPPQCLTVKWPISKTLRGPCIAAMAGLYIRCAV